jgi:hypothetical protein
MLQEEGMLGRIAFVASIIRGTLWRRVLPNEGKG